MRFPWWRSGRNRDLQDEIADHFRRAVADRVARGETIESARAAVRREFGNVGRVEELTRESWGWSWLIDLGRDFRLGARRLYRSPGYSMVAITTLSLVIGANTAIFSAARAVLLKPLPYRDPGSLVAMYEHRSHSADDRFDLSPPNLVDYQARQTTLTGLASFIERPATWRVGNGDPQIVPSMSVTANLFPLLGVSAWRGRTFGPGDDQPGGSFKAIVSYRFWSRELGADTAAVGRTITLHNRAYDLIGIMPPGFTLGGDEAIWVPLDLTEELAQASVTRKQRFYQTIGRLGPGVSLAAATAELITISHALEREYPEANTDFVAGLVPLHQTLAANFRRPILLLMGAAGLILLIACANLANVTLSRSISRRPELAVRAALGAARSRLAREVIAESVLLSLVGGGLGVALAAALTRGLLSLNPAVLRGNFGVEIDARVLLFSAAISIGTGVLFGLAPALVVARADFQGALKDHSRRTVGHRGSERFRHGLVVVQIGLTAMLLIGAGLLVRSFGRVINVRLGYDPDQVVTARLRVDGARYDSATGVNQFFDGVLADIAREPGVEAVGAAMYLPAQGKEYSTIFVDGSSTDPDRLPGIAYNMVRGDYFKAIRAPLVAGRLFDLTDPADGPQVAVVNAAAARQFFPGGDAVGKRVRIGPNPKAPWTTIIGVIGDMRDAANWVAPEPTIYDNSRQQTWWKTLSVVVRVSDDPAAAGPIIRRAVKSADPTLGIRDLATLDQVIGTSLAGRKFGLGLASCFALLGLVLAAVGIFGVVSYSVTARIREFGVRLALGASGRDLMVMVTGRGLWAAAIGLALGLAGALAGGRLLASTLYGIQATDLVTFGAVSVGLMVVVVLASAIPASRATRVDPNISLRAE